MTNRSLSEPDAQLMHEAIAWINALNAIIPPDEARPTMTFVILIWLGGHTPAYPLLCCKERESVIEAPLGLHLSLEEAIDGMQRTAGGLAPEGWRFQLMWRECK